MSDSKEDEVIKKSKIRWFMIISFLTLLVSFPSDFNNVQAETIVHHERVARNRHYPPPSKPTVQSKEKSEPVTSKKEDYAIKEPNQPSSSSQIKSEQKEEQPSVKQVDNKDNNSYSSVTSDSNEEKSSENVSVENIETSQIQTPIQTKASYKSSLSSTSAQHFPQPMSFDRALAYQKLHSEDITFNISEEKDQYGNKEKNRCFDFLGETGHYNEGSSISGYADNTGLRFSVQYGFENEKTVPYAVIGWSADLPSGKCPPHFIRFVFSSGYVKEMPLQGWKYYSYISYGLLVNSIAHKYNGLVKLNDYDIYEIITHGNIAAVYIDDGMGGMKHFFYSGDKNAKQKAQLNRGMAHAAKMLDISKDTVSAEYQLQQALAEADRKAKIKAEIRQEITEDMEREALRREVIAEMNAKGQLQK